MAVSRVQDEVHRHTVRTQSKLHTHSQSSNVYDFKGREDGCSQNASPSVFRAQTIKTHLHNLLLCSGPSIQDS